MSSSLSHLELRDLLIHLQKVSPELANSGFGETVYFLRPEDSISSYEFGGLRLILKFVPRTAQNSVYWDELYARSRAYNSLPPKPYTSKCPYCKGRGWVAGFFESKRYDCLDCIPDPIPEVDQEAVRIEELKNSLGEMYSRYGTIEEALWNWKLKFPFGQIPETRCEEARNLLLEMVCEGTAKKKMWI